MTPYLTDTEVLEIVKPLRQPAAIVRWFKDHGFNVVRKPNGLPLVGRDHFTLVMGGNQQPAANSESQAAPGINVQAMLDRYRGKGADYGHGKKAQKQSARAA